MKMLKKLDVVKKLRILYPLWAITGMFSILYVSSELIIFDDPAKTATNIANNELLFRMGIVGSLITQLFYLLIVLLLYKLYKPVNENISKQMVILVIVAVPIAMLNVINQIGALLATNSPDLMMLFLNLNEYGIYIASIFWGLWLFPLGYLTKKSNYMPSMIGILLYIGAFGYLLNSFTNLLFPEFDTLLAITEFMTLGEIIFILWLVIKGIKIGKS